MPLDTAQVIALIKQPLSPAERAQSDAIHYALAAALEEYSLRVKSVGFLRTYDAAVTAGDRTVTLTGANDDMESIFALKLGTGTTQAVLTYVPPQMFLERYDNPAETAGTPTKYTILISEDGWPVVKFNCPLAASDTVTVYYFMSIGEADIQMARSTSAMVPGALSYFYGIQSELGEKYYNAFLGQIKLARATDTFTPKEPDQMYLSKEYRDVKASADAIKGNRT